MQITISYDSLYATVSRSLSIIGKRSVDDQGNLLFKDITLSSIEKEIVYDYFEQAVVDIANETAAFITNSYSDAIVLSFPGNHNDSLDVFIQRAASTYIVSHALYSWLFITAPRIAPRYLEDCKRQMTAIIRLINEKKAPEQPQGVSPLDISTSVQQQDNP